jgi:hypothetical protein
MVGSSPPQCCTGRWIRSDLIQAEKMASLGQLTAGIAGLSVELLDEGDYCPDNQCIGRS